MANRFFLISQVFYPDEVSTAGLLTDMCRVLVEKGIETEVWCAQPSYSKEKSRQSRRVIYDGIDIHYLASTNFYKGNFAGRIINVFTFTISVIFRLLFSRERTPVFSHTTPPTLGIIISFLCHIKRRKFNYILLDIFPEGLIRLGKVSRSNPIIRLWHFLFKASLIRSDKIIVIGRDMQRWITGICSKCISKIRYIPLWQREDRISPETYSENQLVRHYKLDNKFVVQYSGNMGLWNDMETLGRAVIKMPDVVFMFVGGGVRRTELFRFFGNGQENVIDLQFQPSENLNSVLSCCHVAVVTMKNGLEGMAVPSKIYGILASGKPVIALVPEESEIAYVVREERCGIVVLPGDVEGFTKAVRLLMWDEDLRKKMGANSSLAFNSRYTLSKAAQNYICLLDEQD